LAAASLIMIGSAGGQVRGGAATHLAGTPTGGSPGKFYEDIGAYAFRGTGTDLAEGSTVEMYRRTSVADWARIATSVLTTGGYAASLPVQAAGIFTFVATTGGAPGSGEEGTSAPVTVTVEDARIILDAPVRRIDSLLNPRVRGSIVPGRAGVTVREVLGAADRTVPDVVAALGPVLGLPDLPYVRVPDDEMEAALREAGMPADGARLHVAMNRAFNEGRVGSLAGRGPATTTPTTVEDWAATLPAAAR